MNKVKKYGWKIIYFHINTTLTKKKPKIIMEITDMRILRVLLENVIILMHLNLLMMK